MSEPERNAASMMTTARETPEMIELRRGKSRARATLPSGASLITAPRSQSRVVQLHVLRRIRMIQPAGEHADRAGGERASVRGCVDAAGEAGDDSESRRAEIGGKPFSEHQRRTRAFA